MPDKRFLKTIQGFTARRAVAPSAVRGSRKGTVDACRQFLRNVELSQFGTADKAAFDAALNRTTNRLATRLGSSHRKWGVARKILNIFLRDCLYTCWLRDAHNLSDAEYLMEMPLDSITADNLSDEYEELPRWQGVRHVHATLNREYQEAALVVAEGKGMARVHLDAQWWSRFD